MRESLKEDEKEIKRKLISVSKKYFRPAVRILKLSKSFKILLIERAVGFLPPRTHPPLLCPGHLLRGFLTVSNL